MVTRRDRALLILLMVNAAMDAITTSAHLAEVAPRSAIALVGLISAALSAVTGVYVVATREPPTSPERVTPGAPDRP